MYRLDAFIPAADSSYSVAGSHIDALMFIRGQIKQDLAKIEQEIPPHIMREEIAKELNGGEAFPHFNALQLEVERLIEFSKRSPEAGYHLRFLLPVLCRLFRTRENKP